MENRDCRFSYSDFDDSLIVSCKDDKENVKDRFNFGNFIFNLTGRGKIVGIQVLNASEVLQDYNIKSNLSDLKNVSLITGQKENCLFVALVLMFKNQEAKIPITLMSMPPIAN